MVQSWLFSADCGPVLQQWLESDCTLAGVRLLFALEGSLSWSMISSYSGTGPSVISSGTAVYDTESKVVEFATTTGALPVKKLHNGLTIPCKLL